MLFLQFAIGALNDWADATADAGRTGKPIVAGVVSREAAPVVAVVCAVAGLVIAATAGPVVAALGLGGLATGVAYDIGLKGTPGAWLCFAAGFILLPLFAWYGAAGAAPAFLPWIVVLALPAGAVVSLANGLVDLEADKATGRRTPAVILGREAALSGLIALDLAIIAGVAVSLATGRAPTISWLGVILGAALAIAGWWLSRWPTRRASLDGWRVQAVGLAVLAASWFAGMAA
jgi:protoheme IX farnesyltransferase